jgi:glutathione synthase/RimK-type ligase-like ATP-grasp enzyme
LDEKIIASYRIVTQALDFRQNEEAVETIELSKEVQNQCLDAAKTIGLRFTGMDLKGDSNGTLRFLELNPSPMFLGFDKLAGTNILEQFSDVLSNHTEPLD